MIDKVRKSFKRQYEKNSKSLNRLYFLSMIVLILTRKYKPLKEEMDEAMQTHLDLSSLSKKEIKKYRKEQVVFRVIYKVRPTEFFSFKMLERTPEERETYITREMTNSYYRVINNFKALRILNDKYLTYKVFNDLFNRDVTYVSSAKNKKEFIKFAKEHGSYVVKEVDSYGGMGVQFCNVKDYKNDDEIYDAIKEHLPVLVEEVVEQGEAMAKFHKESLNTARIVTFQKDGKVSFVWAFFRVGSGGSKVDNMSSGGLGAQIDPETGKIITDALDYKGTHVSEHPDSHIKFKGYQLPEWDKLKEKILLLTSRIPSVHCVGWDMAYSKKGWVLVEANGRAQVVAIQTLTNSGYRPLFEKMAYLIDKDNNSSEELEEEEM